MAAGHDAGTAFMDVLPRLQGWGRQLDQQLNQEIAGGSAGQAAGRAAGRKVAEGVEGEITRSSGRMRGAFDALATHGSGRLAEVGRVGSAVSKGLDDVAASGANVGTALRVGVVGGVLAVAAALTAMVVSVGAFSRVTEEVDDLQDRMGGTAEQASKLRNIGRALGIDTNTLGNAVFRLANNLDRNRESLQASGVQIAKNRDGTTDLYGTLLNLSDAYRATEDPQQRNVLLMEALGRGGDDLIDVLEKGRGELERFANSGPIANKEQIAQGEKYRESIRLLGMAFERLTVTAGGPLAQGITLVATTLSMAADYAASFAEKTRGLRSILGKIVDYTGLGWLVRWAQASGAAAAAADRQAASQRELQDRLESVKDTLERLATAQETALDAGLSLADAHQRVADAQRAIADGQRDLARNARDIAAAERDIARAREDARRKERDWQQEQHRRQREILDARDDLRNAIEEHGAASDQARDGLQRLVDMEQEQADAASDHAEDNDSVAEAERRLAELQEERGRIIRDQAGLQRDLERSYVDLARAQRDHEVAQREANGQTVTAIEKTEMFKQKLQALSGTIDGPLASSLRQMANSILSMPSPRDIAFNVSTNAFKVLENQAGRLGFPDVATMMAVLGMRPANVAYDSPAGPPAPVLTPAGPPAPTSSASSGGGTYGLPGSNYGLPGLADGGLVRARPGGTIVRIGEGGEDEVVTPVSRLRGTSQHNTWIINNPVPEPATASIPKAARRAALELAGDR